MNELTVGRIDKLDDYVAPEIKTYKPGAQVSWPKPQTASDSLSPVKERLLELQNKFIDQLNKIRGDCDIIEARIKTRVIKVNDEFAHLGLMFNDTVQKSREMTEALAEIQKTIGD